MQVGDEFIPWQLFVGLFIPNALARFPGLSPGAKIVYGRLAQYAGKDGVCYPSQKEIADETGMTERHIGRVIRELERYKFIRATRPEGRDRLFHRRTNYVFLWNDVLSDSVRSGPDKMSSSMETIGPVVDKDVKENHEKENHTPISPARFLGKGSKELITSDTPLPPVLQAEWNRLIEVYPKPSGIVKGRDRAVRIFAGAAERARILRNARHYSCDPAVKRGFVMALDKFVESGFRDYDTEPLGDEVGSPDVAWMKNLEADEEAARKERAETGPRKILPIDGQFSGGALHDQSQAARPGGVT